MQRLHPVAPATTILTAVEVQTLLALAGSTEDAQTTDFSVSQAVIAIAKLGGFLARKHDGEPGPAVIWRS